MKCVETYRRLKAHIHTGVYVLSPNDRKTHKKKKKNDCLSECKVIILKSVKGCFISSDRYHKSTG